MGGVNEELGLHFLFVRDHATKEPRMARDYCIGQDRITICIS